MLKLRYVNLNIFKAILKTVIKIIEKFDHLLNTVIHINIRIPLLHTWKNYLDILFTMYIWKCELFIIL